MSNATFAVVITLISFSLCYVVKEWANDYFCSKRGDKCNQPEKYK